MTAAEGSTELQDEPDWIRHRMQRLQAVRRLVDDPQAGAAIDALIAEAEARLVLLEKA